MSQLLFFKSQTTKNVIIKSFFSRKFDLHTVIIKLDHVDKQNRVKSRIVYEIDRTCLAIPNASLANVATVITLQSHLSNNALISMKIESKLWFQNWITISTPWFSQSTRFNGNFDARSVANVCKYFCFYTD